MKKITVEPYDPKWEDAFIQLKNVFLKKIDKSLRVEHIGSTSIPGISAKPIIDIDIVVKTEDEVNHIINHLTELGYIHQGDLGIEGREAFKRSIQDVPLLFEDHDKWYPHHLYVCLEDSLAFKNHMLFKAYLTDNEDAIKEYSALKLTLAHKYPDNMAAYISGKTPFIARALKASGLEPKDVEKIVLVNS